MNLLYERARRIDSSLSQVWLAVLEKESQRAA
jgi:hypothetical protein